MKKHREEACQGFLLVFFVILSFINLWKAEELR